MIDPTKPIIAVCGHGHYPAEVDHTYVDEQGQTHVVAKILRRHRIRIGDEWSPPDMWNFLDDGTFDGNADIRIVNRKEKTMTDHKKHPDHDKPLPGDLGVERTRPTSPQPADAPPQGPPPTGPHEPEPVDQP